MQLSSLNGQTLKGLLVFECEPIHTAWVDKLTTSIVTWAAFLDLSVSGLVEVTACEVDLHGRYPALGLKLHPSMDQSLRATYRNGEVAKAEPLKEAGTDFPALIVGTEESDPLGEGQVSQYALILDNSKTVLLRHVMPPTTLGIVIE